MNQKYISDSLRRKKQKTKNIYLIIGISIFALILGLLMYLATLPVFYIQHLKIEGTIFVEKTEIEQKTQEILNKKILWFIPIKNIFLFPKNELEESLKQNPAIISVKIRKKLFNTLSITIEEHAKQMIYCVYLDKSECYYVNDDGFLYSKVKEYIIPEQEILIFDERGSKKIEDVLIEKEKYEDILLFVKNLSREEIYIKEIYIHPDMTVDFVSRTDTIFKVSVFDDFRKDYANLIALFEKQILTKDILQTIEYIDLRFGNKVFYKNKTN